jgi:hypothetical protein
MTVNVDHLFFLVLVFCLFGANLGAVDCRRSSWSFPPVDMIFFLCGRLWVGWLAHVLTVKYCWYYFFVGFTHSRYFQFYIVLIIPCTPSSGTGITGRHYSSSGTHNSSTRNSEYCYSSTSTSTGPNTKLAQT